MYLCYSPFFYISNFLLCLSFGKVFVSSKAGRDQISPLLYIVLHWMIQNEGVKCSGHL